MFSLVSWAPAFGSEVIGIKSPRSQVRILRLDVRTNAYRTPQQIRTSSDPRVDCLPARARYSDFCGLNTTMLLRQLRCSNSTRGAELTSSQCLLELTSFGLPQA